MAIGPRIHDGGQCAEALQWRTGLHSRPHVLEFRIMQVEFAHYRTSEPVAEMPWRILVQESSPSELGHQSPEAGSIPMLFATPLFHQPNLRQRTWVDARQISALQCRHGEVDL